jgi:hypothetical protein
MKQNTFRIITSCVVAIVACGVGIYSTVHRNSRNSVDNQINIDYQAHPVASIIGSILPGITVGFAFYWLSGWRAKRKQNKLSSITPKEAASLLASNIDGQYDDVINGFLLNAAARDIQEFILNIHDQSGYIQRARTALDIRLAEDAKIHSRRTVHLTWALLFVSVALLAFPFLQMIISKNHDVVKVVANDAKTNTVTQTADSDFDKYKKLAENGNAEAQDKLGYCYEFGKGVAEDDAEAVKWYRKSADQNYAHAQWWLGDCYQHGWIHSVLPKDVTEAVKWYLKAADQGDSRSQYSLGYCYETGEGVAEDDAEAVRWYRKSAEQNWSEAELRLGFCYGSAKGVAEDDAEAVKWYLKAADQGDYAAQFSLGYYYEYGKGVAQNLVEAYKWYNLASVFWGTNATASRDTVAASMTPDQIAEAQKLSSEFKPQKESASGNSSSP